MSQPTRTVNVQDAKTHLSRLLRAVEAGEEIAIARAGTVIARLVRAEVPTQRTWGGLEGWVQVDEDAFAPLDDDDADDWDEGPLDP